MGCGIWMGEGVGGLLLPKYLLDLHENWYSKVFLDEESNKKGFKIEKMNILTHIHTGCGIWKGEVGGILAPKIFARFA